MFKIKKYLFIFLFSIIGFSLFNSCTPPPDCEVYNEGNVIFYDDGPSWTWDGCYIEVDWTDGSYNTGLFYGSRTYYDKSVGRADVYMEWEDADGWYWNNGHIDLIQCQTVNAYCRWSRKKSAIVNPIFIIEEYGSVKKSDITSIEEYRKKIKENY